MNKVFLFFCPLFIWTQSGAELAIMLDQKPSPKNLKNHLEMTLTNSKGKSRVNRMISKSMEIKITAYIGKASKYNQKKERG